MQPTRSSLPALNHVTLFDAFREMFELHLGTMQWPKEEWPVLVKTYPRDRISTGGYDHAFDVILFHIVESETASTSNDGERKPKGLWTKQTREHPTKKRYQVVESGWQEKVTVQFTILAKSNERADALVDWFHRMVLTYVFAMQFFRTRGVSEFRFEKRLEDKESKEYGQELYSRPLRYSLRLDLAIVSEAKVLERVDVKVNGLA